MWAAGVTSFCPWDGRTCFAPDLQALYLEYDLIGTTYQGWGLQELKSLSYRERQYWKSLIAWRREKHGLGA